MMPKIPGSDSCALTGAAENLQSHCKVHAEYKKLVRNVKVVHPFVIQTYSALS